MNKIIIALVILMVMAGVSYASSVAVYERARASEIQGWSINVRDNDVDAVASLVTELDTTYAQLADEDTIEIVSSSALDITQTVTVKGINDKGNQISEDIALDTTAGTTEVTSTNTFRFIDQVSVDKECAGTITIRRATGNTFITSIPAGELEAGMAQHFNGEKNAYVSSWSGVTEDTSEIKLELRWYPDDDDALDASDGYKVLDRMTVATLDTIRANFAQPIKCDDGGWLAVYGAGRSNNMAVSVTIQGWDSNF